MTQKNRVPYGSWPSIITSQLLTEGKVSISEPQWDQGDLYWLERRPAERGRTTIMCQKPNQTPVELTPHPIDVRSKVHEYGGGSYTVSQGLVVFVAGDDQQVYRIDTEQSMEPVIIGEFENYRFADLIIDHSGRQVIAVAEHHGETVENSLVSLSLDEPKLTTLACGRDFYANPRLSPDGTQLAWVSWNLPHMPWDVTELWSAPIDEPSAARKIVGSGDEAICQPRWLDDERLLFVSDRDNWWNLYSVSKNGHIERITMLQAEFATPPWVFGMSCYGVIDRDTLICAYTQDGYWSIAKLTLSTNEFDWIEQDAAMIEGVQVDSSSGQACFIRASTYQLPQLISWKDGVLTSIGQSETLIPKDHVATPESIVFTSASGRAIHSFFYPPCHAKVTGPEGEKPPLIVMCHGGPSGATSSALSLKVQFWTNRGFAVLDVNYVGSTGFGRQFRHQLYGQWGVADVDDICEATRFMVKRGDVNPEQLIIRGSSAGGYTVLAALTQQPLFKAGASLYGIGDLHLLAKDTHKFEARYLDQLIAPYEPAYLDIYDQRSPINHIEELSSPVIFLQGLKDKVVPPNQAEAMVDALANKGINVAYVTYPEEGHGFRQAATIEHSLLVEYAFYADQFGFNPCEKVPTVPYVKANS